MGAPVLEDFAIVIGITYPDASLAGLTGTLRDAAAFTEWLLDPEGGNVPKKNIRAVLSPEKQRSLTNARPLQDKIDDELKKIGVNGTRKPIGRRLYFYFSGHGFGPKPSDICMLLAGATSTELNLNISLSLYRDFFRNTSYFEEVLYILDCCRDPTPPVLGFSPGPPRFTPSSATPAGLVSDAILAAAANGKKSHEMIDPRIRRRRGLFTMALLDVLQNTVGVDPRGQHTAFNLQQNLRKRVNEIVSHNRLKGVEQLPTLDISDHRGTNLVLAKPPITPVPVRIIAPKGAAGDLMVLENNIVPIDCRPADKATARKTPWLVDLLPTKLYVVRHTREDGTSVDIPIDWTTLPASSKDGEYDFVLPNT
jgi:hypothetical protein